MQRASTQTRGRMRRPPEPTVGRRSASPLMSQAAGKARPGCCICSVCARLGSHRQRQRHAFQPGFFFLGVGVPLTHTQCEAGRRAVLLSAVPALNRTCGVHRAVCRLLHVLEELTLGRARVTQQQHVDVAPQPAAARRTTSTTGSTYIKPSAPRHSRQPSTPNTLHTHRRHRTQNARPAPAKTVTPVAVGGLLLHTAKQCQGQGHLDVVVPVDAGRNALGNAHACMHVVCCTPATACVTPTTFLTPPGAAHTCVPPGRLLTRPLSATWRTPHTTACIQSCDCSHTHTHRCAGLLPWL